jgi:hypothetical protein
MRGFHNETFYFGLTALSFEDVEETERADRGFAQGVARVPTALAIESEPETHPLHRLPVLVAGERAGYTWRGNNAWRRCEDIDSHHERTLCGYDMPATSTEILKAFRR